MIKIYFPNLTLRSLKSKGVLSVFFQHYNLIVFSHNGCPVNKGIHTHTHKYVFICTYTHLYVCIYLCMYIYTQQPLRMQNLLLTNLLIYSVDIWIHIEHPKHAWYSSIWGEYSHELKGHASHIHGAYFFYGSEGKKNHI